MKTTVGVGVRIVLCLALGVGGSGIGIGAREAQAQDCPQPAHEYCDVTQGTVRDYQNCQARNRQEDNRHQECLAQERRDREREQREREREQEQQREHARECRENPDACR
jgi:uncharacterized protein HemX